MTEKKQPVWLRVLEIIFGISSIILSIVIIINTEIAIELLVVLFSFGLLFFGIRNLTMGTSSKLHSKKIKGLLIGSGTTVMILAAIVLLYPEMAIEAMIVLLSITMVIIGFASITIGLTRKWSNIQRGISIGTGAIVLILAVPVIIYPDLAMFAIIILLSMSFLINGMEIITSGIIGHRQKNIFSFKK